MAGFPRHTSPQPHREQWARVLRWHERLRIIMREPQADPNDAMDVCLALFVNLHHLGEWITGTDPSLKPAVRSHVHGTPALQLARDLCNGSKHLTLTSASVDPRFLTAMEYVPPPLAGEPDGPGYRLMMLTDEARIDMLTLAGEAIESWRRFLDAHGLAAARDRALGSSNPTI